MKKKKIIFIFIILVALSVFIFVKYRTHSSNIKPNEVWVKTTLVKESTLPIQVHAIGTLVAPTVEITPEIPGHVDKIFFVDGSFVKKGTILIQLDDAVYKAQFESAKAKLTFSENTFKRMSLLGKQGAISKQAIDQADSDLREKKAAAQESEVMVNKMKLIAPFDGVVGKSKVNPGDYVTINKMLVMLTDRQHLRIEYNVPDKYLPLLKLGQEVTITTTAYPKKKFSGKVAYISPTINTDNRSVSLYAFVSNEENLLAPGMFVTIKQALGKKEKVLMIPSRSLVPILGGEQVYKFIGGKAFAVKVVVGRRTRDAVQVESGLTSGDVVITDGQIKVKNGAEVKVKRSSS